MTASWYLVIPVLFPAVVGILTACGLFENRTRRAVVSCCLGINVLLMIPVLLSGEKAFQLFSLSRDLPVFLKSDDIAKFFAALMNLVWFGVGIYSFEYMEHEKSLNRYYGFYLMTGGALTALCMSGSIVTFYMFYELMALLSVPMVVHTMQKDAVAAGIKYLIYSVLGASLALLGMFLLAGNVSSFSFAPGGVLNDAGKAEARDTVLAAGMLMIVGFGTKAGMFPLHGWLPTAHPVAPAPASAVLSGIITKSGVLGVYRVVYELIGAEALRGSWVQIVFLALTMFTVFSGSLLAYKEQLLKKRLAYSSVSQVSYVLFGLATMTAPGVIGALLHVCAHSLIKDTLFMSAGAIIHRTGKTRVEELEGIGKRMPKVMTCFTVVSLGLVGIPPCLGFVSKWYLAQGSLAAAGIPEWLTWLGPAVLLVSALLTAGYLLSIVIRGFFPSREIPEESLTKCDPGASMWIPMACFALLSVALGVFPGKLIALFSSIAASVL